jgi:hypothetical protein
VTTDPRSTAELLDDPGLDLADNGVSERLDAIRATAERDGVRVQVDVHGALTDLSIAESALRQAPHQLAAAITGLAAAATRTATAEALALLYWAGGAALAPHLAAAVAAEPPATPALVGHPAEPDTLEPTSWAATEPAPAPVTAARRRREPEPADPDTFEPTSWALS